MRGRRPPRAGLLPVPHFWWTVAPRPGTRRDDRAHRRQPPRDVGLGRRPTAFSAAAALALLTHHGNVRSALRAIAPNTASLPVAEQRAIARRVFSGNPSRSPSATSAGRRNARPRCGPRTERRSSANARPVRAHRECRPVVRRPGALAGVRPATRAGGRDAPNPIPLRGS
jgi:hypothetical protein